MTGIEFALVYIILIVVLIYSGLYVAVSLGLVSFIGVLLARGLDTAVGTVSFIVAENVEDHKFAIIPLFVLMGMLASRAGMGADIYQVANALLFRLRGGLGMATVAANAVFAAITGVSIASATVFSQISVPEMRKFGHTKRFSVGVVVGSSVLGMLIPPSVMLLIYAFVTEQAVDKIFIAGVIPGIILSAAYGIGILVISYLYPRVVHQTSFKNVGSQSDYALSPWEIIIKGLPPLLMILLVIGGLYDGWFTPGEAGAAGSLFAFIIAVLKRKLTFRNFWDALMGTGQVTAAIMILILAANLYNSMLGITGMHAALGDWIQGLDMSFAGFMTLFVILLLLMGTILDTISIILLVVPLFLPVIESFDMSLIWFGIVVVVGAEIGLLTPPLGMACFVVKSALADTDISLRDIFMGAIPFAFVMLLVEIALIAFPQLSLWLVERMG